MRSPIGFDFRLLRRAKFVAPPLSSPPRSPVDFADLRRVEGVLPTDPGVAAGAIEGVRPIEPGVRSARSDAIVASFVGGEAPSPTGGGEGRLRRTPERLFSGTAPKSPLERTSEAMSGVS